MVVIVQQRAQAILLSAALHGIFVQPAEACDLYTAYAPITGGLGMIVGDEERAEVSAESLTILLCRKILPATDKQGFIAR